MQEEKFSVYRQSPTFQCEAPYQLYINVDGNETTNQTLYSNKYTSVH